MLNRRSFLGSGAALFAAAGCRSICGGNCSDAAPAAAKPRAEGAYTLGKVKFKLGMAGYTYNKYTLDETLAEMKALDVRWLCIKSFHLPLSATAAQIAEFKRKCADFGVTGYGVGPIYMSSQDEAKKAFDYAAAIGVKTIVGVPFEMKDIDGKKTRVESRSLCEFVDGLCRQYDIRYAIHNHGPDIPYLFPTGQSSYKMVKDLDKRMGLCLDIGHDFRANMDPADSIRKYGDRIYDLHLKNVSDNSKAGKARPFTEGKIDLLDVARALTEVGYEGSCSIEYERDFEFNKHLTGLALSVGYFRAIMDSIR